MKDKKRSLILLLASGVFFFGLFAVFGVQINNDSKQYMTMHIHRDPGYSFFLWVFQCISQEYGLVLAVIVQTVLNAWCTADFTNYISECFGLKKFSTIVIFMMTLMPHIITPLFSNSHLVLSVGILSEAICLPLFLWFIKELHKACMIGSKKAVYGSLFLSMLLSLIRAQVTAAILIWFFALVFRAIMKKQYKKILILVLAVCLCFGMRTLLTKTYHYVFHGYFVNTTYGPINILTNVLYSADREQGEAIEDDEIRSLFYMHYDAMDEMQYNYKYAGDSLVEQASYLESVHDSLKFEVCEAGFKQYLLEQGVDDYTLQNFAADEYASKLTTEIFGGCFGRWFPTYLVLGIRGAIRNVAIVHPILSIYALLLGVTACVMTVVFLKKNRDSKEAWFMLIALLTIAGISFSTALTIMCLSRYMVYGFAGFYTAAYLMLLKVFNNYKKKSSEA